MLDCFFERGICPFYVAYPKGQEKSATNNIFLLVELHKMRDYNFEKVFLIINFEKLKL